MLVQIPLWAKSCWASTCCEVGTARSLRLFCPPAYLCIALNSCHPSSPFFKSFFLFFSPPPPPPPALLRRDAQVSLPGGRCQFTPSIFCYSSPLGVNQTWTASLWCFFWLHFWLLPSVWDGRWVLALPKLKSTTRPSRDFCGTKIASEVGADVILHGGTSASQRFTEKSFGRAVVGSSISFCSFSLLIIIGSSFQWIKRLVSTEQ